MLFLIDLTWNDPEVSGGVHVQVPSPPFRISETAGRIALNFSVLGGPQAKRFTQDGDICTRARVTVNTYKHIYFLSLVHRPKGVILVTVMR